MSNKLKSFLIFAFILFVIWMALAACSIFKPSDAQKANRKLRKADRLIEQAIALGAVVKRDTIYKEIIIPGDSTTLVLAGLDRVRDTIIYKDRIKLHIQQNHDTLRVNVDCPPDTVRVPVIVKQDIKCPPLDHTWRTIALVLIGVLIVGAIFMKFR